MNAAKISSSGNPQNLKNAFSDEGPLQDITKVVVTFAENNSAQSHIFRPEENPGTLVIDVSMKDMADFLIPGLISFLKKHFQCPRIHNVPSNNKEDDNG